MKFSLKLFLIMIFVTMMTGQVMVTNAATNAGNPIPVMAYYYIWFDESSWERAKTDYPALGRYSSDDPEVIRQHIRWAKDAGINGFIVSWKSTFKLDKRLEQLMDIAFEEDFRLWIIYQGLDFDRNPLNTDWIDADFEYFIETYADHPVFAADPKPVLIWSGTWEFTPQEINSITAGYRHYLTILASERQLEGYKRLIGMVDGNAYYWSSADPLETPNYREKLNQMGELVHENGGMWVAPAAAGFDARLIGGTRVIERRDGDTLREAMNAAVASSPDAVGIISWNEFSENSHIEPSVNYGKTALEVLADRDLGQIPQIYDFDSNAPATTDVGSLYPILVLGGAFAFVVGNIVVIARRERKYKKSKVNGL
jgi:hypothetical protein